MPAVGLTDEYALTAARGVVAGAKAAALLTRSNARDCLMMLGVAAQRCGRRFSGSAYAVRRCSASGVQRSAAATDAELSKSKHAFVLKLVSYIR